MIDLSLAFDTIETENILPYKLKYYGADQKTVEFFKSFFCDRKQFAEWNGTKSETVCTISRSAKEVQLDLLLLIIM